MKAKLKFPKPGMGQVTMGQIAFGKVGSGIKTVVFAKASFCEPGHLFQVIETAEGKTTGRWILVQVIHVDKWEDGKSIQQYLKKGTYALSVQVLCKGRFENENTD